MNMECTETNPSPAFLECDFCSYKTISISHLKEHSVIHLQPELVWKTEPDPIDMNEVECKTECIEDDWHIMENDPVVSNIVQGKLESTSQKITHTSVNVDIHVHLTSNSLEPKPDIGHFKKLEEKSLNGSCVSINNSIKVEKCETTSQIGDIFVEDGIPAAEILENYEFSDLDMKTSVNENNSSTNDSLEQNVKISKKLVCYNCQYCKFSSFYLESYRRHLIKHTGIGMYTCNFCTYESNNSYNFKLHLSKHTGDNMFQCQLCSYKTVYKQVFRKHMRKHNISSNGITGSVMTPSSLPVRQYGRRKVSYLMRKREETTHVPNITASTNEQPTTGIVAPLNEAANATEQCQSADTTESRAAAAPQPNLTKEMIVNIHGELLGHRFVTIDRQCGVTGNVYDAFITKPVKRLTKQKQPIANSKKVPSVTIELKRKCDLTGDSKFSVFPVNRELNQSTANSEKNPDVTIELKSESNGISTTRNAITTKPEECLTQQRQSTANSARVPSVSIRLKSVRDLTGTTSNAVPMNSEECLAKQHQSTDSSVRVPSVTTRRKNESDLTGKCDLTGRENNAVTTMPIKCHTNQQETTAFSVKVPTEAIKLERESVKIEVEPIFFTDDTDMSFTSDEEISKEKQNKLLESDKTLAVNSGHTIGIKSEYLPGILTPAKHEIVEVLTGLVASTEPLVQRRRRSHKETRMHRCTHCPFTSNWEMSYKRHMIKHTGEGILRCEHCDYTSNNSANLKLHIKKHTGENYTCTFCSYSTVYPHLFRAHLARHTGAGLRCCPHCTYSTGNGGNYRKHLETHMRNQVREARMKTIIKSGG